MSLASEAHAHTHQRSSSAEHLTGKNTVKSQEITSYAHCKHTTLTRLREKGGSQRTCIVSWSSERACRCTTGSSSAETSRKLKALIHEIAAATKHIVNMIRRSFSTENGSYFPSSLPQFIDKNKAESCGEFEPETFEHACLMKQVASRLGRDEFLS